MGKLLNTRSPVGLPIVNVTNSPFETDEPSAEAFARALGERILELARQPVEDLLP